ncbi:ADP-ribosylglycohydrolase family protein [Paratissierella segnis]|uniref:ADP-ribosylglycohydrolase family protein n=1 Tax=Paratissierella segnis TaxID=2763679 RepID=A0A926EYX7_9FIRM|nr:ADP-ribosylglycohydrolase family protein [Paratissierella segnis]MBC8588949.1 ADP-ribosylglycohydrolase family protein [Paratissierella segnis]
MKAWEREYNWKKTAFPSLDTEEKENNWMEYLENGNLSDERLYKDWESFVPGSLAPCHLVVAAIQSMDNRGYDVSEAEELIDIGLKAAKKKDPVLLQQITARIYYLLNNAPRNKNSSYWKYKHYQTWEDIEGEVDFPDCESYNVYSDDFADKIKAGWVAQLIGGALGTQIEGYNTDNIRKIFGEVREYLRKPETYNDDITYELAFLETFVEKGYSITSEDIAYKWLAFITDGYSAEETALCNLRRGLMPPQSGIQNNYFSDWIGSQMRTAIHGMVAPGNPRLAAKLAVYDSVISHSNNGMIGGMFNAILVSLCFTESDIRKVVEKTVYLMPYKSQYYEVVRNTLNICKSSKDWEEAWGLCQERLKEYHWIHAYPNAAAEIVALWFGNGDFDETAYIIAMEGEDVDCNAGPILNALAIIIGLEGISKSWIEPLGNIIKTFMRKMDKFTIDSLVEKTITAVRHHSEKLLC